MYERGWSCGGGWSASGDGNEHKGCRAFEKHWTHSFVAAHLCVCCRNLVLSKKSNPLTNAVRNNLKNSKIPSERIDFLCLQQNTTLEIHNFFHCDRSSCSFLCAIVVSTHVCVCCAFISSVIFNYKNHLQNQISKNSTKVYSSEPAQVVWKLEENTANGKSKWNTKHRQQVQKNRTFRINSRINFRYLLVDFEQTLFTVICT